MLSAAFPGGLPEGGFEENRGQVLRTDGSSATEVHFRYGSGQTDIFLLSTGLAFQFHRLDAMPEEASEPYDDPFHPAGADRRKALGSRKLAVHRMDMYLVGARADAATTVEEPLFGHTNHPGMADGPVMRYRRVVRHDVYPGIDWVLYTTPQGLKYDFVVRPGGDPAHIVMRFEHHEELRLDNAGRLIHGNRLGKFVEEAPVSYQGNEMVRSAFHLDGNELRFTLGAYDSTRTLVIDPDRSWATYYGGSGSELLLGTAVAEDGGVFVAGTTDTPIGIAAGGYQELYAGGSDAMVVHFDALGQRVWATYIGGSGYESAYDVSVGTDGSVYVIGVTTSTTGVAIAGAQNEHSGGGEKGFLLRLDANGQRLWGTYIGMGGVTFGYACKAHPAGGVVAVGYTGALNGIALNGHQAQLSGDMDAFVIRYTASGARAWGTYYGGDQNDIAYGCDVAADGSIYVAGATRSSAGVAWGGHQPQCGGPSWSRDAFLLKLDASGVRQWATYYGGEGEDLGYDCATDLNGHVFLAGSTESATGIAHQGHQNTAIAQGDGFLAKFDGAGQRAWGTYYGGAGPDGARACATDRAGNVYLVGMTKSYNGIAQNAFQPELASQAYDAFIAKFRPSGYRAWGTYYGGMGSDQGFGAVADANGNIIMAGGTTSPDAVAEGGFQTQTGGGGDGLVAKLTTGEPYIPLLGLLTDTVCAGDMLTVSFLANGAFGAGNVFSVQLSNAEGNFELPVVLASFPQAPASPVEVVVPAGTAEGASYRVRVVASVPVVWGYPSDHSLVVKTLTAWYLDQDGDGLGEPSTVLYACDQPVGYILSGGDCDDNDPEVAGAGTPCDPGPGYQNGILTADCTCTGELINSVEEASRAGALRIMPNPGTGEEFRIALPTAWAGRDLRMELYDVQGCSVGRWASLVVGPDAVLILRPANLAPGVYTVRVETAFGRATGRMLIVR